MKDKPVKPQPDSAKGGRRKYAGLGRDVQSKIGQHLRTMYDEVVQEGVPEHFAKLLDQLDSPPENKPEPDKEP